MRSERDVVSCYRCTVVCVCVCLCHELSCAKTAEPIEMVLGAWTAGGVLGGNLDFPRERALLQSYSGMCRLPAVNILNFSR